MSESGDVEGRSDGHLIKVLEVLDGGEAFLGRTAHGGTARFSLGQLAHIRRGSVVFVSEDRWEVVPESAWPEIPEVAIIRKVLDDGLLIEYGAGIRFVPGHPSVEVTVGNTVQFSEVDGVLRVLEQGPVRYRDEGVGDDSIDEYLVPSGVDGPTFASLPATTTFASVPLN